MERRDEKRLTALLAALGCPGAEGWAHSQVAEGIPQLARYLFLRQAWSRIAPEPPTAWLDAEVRESKRHPDASYAGIGHSVEALRAKGATDAELGELVRASQAIMLFQLCYLRDDPCFRDIAQPLPDGESLEDVNWGLFLTDRDGQPVQRVQGLYESVQETDPTGREVRPKRAAG